ncbi:MAG: beta-ketoacyl synthase N-terminal-like domain-containing protein, partial [Cyclobacteriaceae bacterium]
GVTRCRSYQKYAPMAYDEYVTLRNENGALFDPVLRYHELHGGQIVQPIANYRKRDPENDGYGVLVIYDIYHRIRKDFKLNAAPVAISGAIDELVEQTISKLLGDSFEDSYEPDLPLMEIGLDSSDLMVLRETLETALDEKISASFFFENSTAELVIEALADKVPAPSVKSTSSETEVKDIARDWKDSDIAIISYSFRFPGAATPEALWELIAGKRSAIEDLPQGRFDFPERVDTEGSHRGIAKGGYIEDISMFDAPFFRISPAEAELMDPQQRIMMELSWEAMERANKKPSDVKGSATGVFIGASGSDYELSLRENVDEESLTGTGTALAILPNRISYFFDLDGPSLQIDTACSSSLVAIHEAVKSINSGECQSAVVGAINLICHPHKNLSYHKTGMLSADGKCHTFDEQANGYVRGEGAAVLLLKPVKKAIEDGDPIKGVIRGSAINHGGQAGGLTVPNPAKQRELVEKAFKNAGITSKDVSYMEAHGTGTPLGDPIEIDGLKNAFRAMSDTALATNSCGIGSVKTNIGHLEAAAGLAGVIKVLLAMEKEQLPPTNNFYKLNGKIELSDSPFYIQENLADWKKDQLIAGVSSFGIGGANGHVVLEGYKNTHSDKKLPKQEEYLYVLSAKNEKALKSYAERYLTFLADGKCTDLAALCFATQVYRQEMDFRLAVTIQSIKDLEKSLTDYINGVENSNLLAGNARKGETAFKGKNFVGNIKKSALGEVAKAWVNGAKISWTDRYQPNSSVEIQLPVYPFERKTYWFTPSEHNESSVTSRINKKENNRKSYWDEVKDTRQATLNGSIAIEKYAESIAVIRLQNHPSNAIGELVIDDLITAFLAITHDKDIKTVILAGDAKAFS